VPLNLKTVLFVIRGVFFPVQFGQIDSNPLQFGQISGADLVGIALLPIHNRHVEGGLVVAKLLAKADCLTCAPDSPHSALSALFQRTSAKALKQSTIALNSGNASDKNSTGFKMARPHPGLLPVRRPRLWRIFEEKE
jgi:hypothetical protein